MNAKRKPPARGRRGSENIRVTAGRPGDAPSRTTRRRGGTAPAPSREPRNPRSGPQTKPIPRAGGRPVSPKNTRQAKARAKARKAKAPRVGRAPLRERLIARLATIDLRPRTLAAKVPFVVLVIGSLGIGLGITLWLSTDAAERSYQLSGIREQNRALLQQKEALERDVRNAESAPALAEAARELGMIPSKDTAHLVQDPAGNWVVVGSPKPADGVPPPPLNTKLADEPPAPGLVEVPVRVPPVMGPPVVPGGPPAALPQGAPQPGAVPQAPPLVAPGAVAMPLTEPAPWPLPGPLPMGLPPAADPPAADPPAPPPAVDPLTVPAADSLVPPPAQIGPPPLIVPGRDPAG